MNPSRLPASGQEAADLAKCSLRLLDGAGRIRDRAGVGHLLERDERRHHDTCAGGCARAREAMRDQFDLSDGAAPNGGIECGELLARVVQIKGDEIVNGVGVTGERHEPIPIERRLHRYIFPTSRPTSSPSAHRNVLNTAAMNAEMMSGSRRRNEWREGKVIAGPRGRGK
jgi:hypothetical protein